MKQDSRLIQGSNKGSHIKGEAMGALGVCAEGLEPLLIAFACSFLPPMWQGEGLHKLLQCWQLEQYVSVFWLVSRRIPHEAKWACVIFDACWCEHYKDLEVIAPPQAANMETLVTITLTRGRWKGWFVLLCYHRKLLLLASLLIYNWGWKVQAKMKSALKEFCGLYKS